MFVHARTHHFIVVVQKLATAMMTDDYDGRLPDLEACGSSPLSM